MKLMNKYLGVLLLSIVSFLSLQAEAQKKVTYTFEGRDGSLVFGWNQKPISLAASGDVPAGVKVAQITGVTYEDGNDSDIDDVEQEAVAGIPFLPQYVVEPQTTANINFDGFKYEIHDIQWRSRTQVPLISSSTKTWVTRWDRTSSVVGDWTFKDNDVGTMTQSSWEVTYHTNDFITEKNFTGLRSLNIECTSKQAYHGVAMKDFIISYYEPVITISNIAAEYGDIASLNPKTYTVKAEITAHAGAFTNAEIQFESSNTSVAEVEKINSLDGDGKAQADVTFKGNGSVRITAKIVYGGSTIASAQTSHKLTVGPEPESEWVPEDGKVYCEYFSSNQETIHRYYREGINVFTSTQLGDNNSGLRLWDQAPKSGSNATADWYNDNPSYRTSTTGGIVQLSTKESNEDFRAALQRIDYKQRVPKYSDVNTSFTFKYSWTSTKKNTRPSDNFSGVILELYRFKKEKTWPEESAPFAKFNTDANTTKTTTDGAIEEVIFREYKEEGRNYSGNTESYTKSIESSSVLFTNNNSNTDNTQTEKYGFLCVIRDISVVGTAQNGLTASLDNTARNATYTYYSYVTFNGNGADDLTAMNTPDSEDGYTTNSYLTVTASPAQNTKELASTAGESLTPNAYTRDGYNFLGWVEGANKAAKLNDDGTLKDGQTVDYTDGANFCPYDALDGGGRGPVTLYAVWKKIPVTDPESPGFNADDYRVYSLWANGGVITVSGEDKDVIADVFMYCSAAPTSVTVATRPGYTFLGYFEDTDESNSIKVFNADGTLNKGTSIISSDGKWLVDKDVYLFAHWEVNSSATVNKTTLTLNGNEGTLVAGKSTTIELIEGSSQNVNIKDYTPTRANYTFAGWYTAANGGTMLYNANGEAVYLEGYSEDGGNVTPIYKAVNEDFFSASGRFLYKSPYNSNFTLYAHWVKNDLTMTFNEGGTSANSAAWSCNSTPATNGVFSSTPAYEEAEYSTVVITRTLKKDKWNTVCFPFDVYADQVKNLFSEVRMYNSVLVKNGEAVMQFVDAETMMAGVPYFVKIKDGYATADNGKAWVSTESGSNITGLTFKNVTISRSPSTISRSVDDVTVDMIGEFNTHIHINENDLYLQNDKFYISGKEYNVGGSNTTVWGNNKGFRCIFRQTGVVGSVKVFNNLTTSINLEGYDGYNGEDGMMPIVINPDNMDPDYMGDIYDLSGRKLSGKPAQGIYIMNGKKYFAK